MTRYQTENLFTLIWTMTVLAMIGAPLYIMFYVAIKSDWEIKVPPPITVIKYVAPEQGGILDSDEPIYLKKEAYKSDDINH